MAPRDLLRDWLASAAARMRRQRWVHDGAWGAAWLGLLAAGQFAVGRLVQPPEVAGALLPLVIFAGAAVLVAVVVRQRRQPRLAEAAAVSDARAGLHDGLLSAHWFSGAAGVDAFQELHVRRAADVAQGLDVRRLFPLAVPRGAALVTAAALALAAAAASLPGPAVSLMEPPQEIASALRTRTPTGAAAAAHVDGESRERVARREPAELWEQIEALAGRFGGPAAGQSLSDAIAARDARAAAQAVEAIRNDGSPGAEVRAVPDEQMSDELAKGILDRLSELLQTGEGAAPAAAPASEADRPTARLDSELRADQEDAQRSAPRQQSEGEDALNTLLRAMSRSSTGGREAIRGEAADPRGGGRASMGGGAMGRRVGTSTAGAGEGDQPSANVAPVADGDSIFGKRTERLAVHLRTVRMPQGSPAEDGGEDRGGTEEATFAATRAQAARTAAFADAASAAASGETVLEGQGAPLEFREAVKRYALTRHRRDAEQRAAEGDGSR
jgi:hypothetical protein